MQFQTLENQTINELCNLFNAAFADYLVKIEMTPESLQDKFDSENVSLEHSVGIFSDGKPVGFIFHALRDSASGKMAYNAGTGVIPKFRGKNATVRMYEYILPKLAKYGVKEVVLEVIDKNPPAIKSYKKVGFTILHELECFKGFPDISSPDKPLIVEESADKFTPPDHFWDWQPTWQNTTQTVLRSGQYKTWSILRGNRAIAYLTGNPGSGRIAQFAVDPDQRWKGLGTSLFCHFAGLSSNTPMVINIADQAGQTQDFLKAIGMTPFLRQYKMNLKLQ
ncbi:GNAT family N-acetyltransferase [uncultured Draconibacterium sp.]|uniref:GNAT family N-acetyltransferase n=1 Tax=uncultured Draconibacterium sp. TaxID=1573823 RepID=UPI002AA8F923|nr:GNAT family N-acetyltransferase [uncultured Draconibacterium sp.]